MSCRNKAGNLITGHLVVVVEKEEEGGRDPFLVGETGEASKVADDSRALLLSSTDVVCGKTRRERCPGDGMDVLTGVIGDDGGGGRGGGSIGFLLCCCLWALACIPVTCVVVSVAWGDEEDEEDDVDDADFDDVRSVVAVVGEDGVDEQDVSLLRSRGGDGMSRAAGG